MTRIVLAIALLTAPLFARSAPATEGAPVPSATAGSSCSCVWVLGTSHYHCTVDGVTRCYGACPK
jgi:hypothetical protein